MQPDALDARAIREILRACLEPRDLISFTDSLRIAPGRPAEEKAATLAASWETEPALRPRIARLLSAATRTWLEQVRLSTEIELERLVLDLDASRARDFWGLVWAMAQDGRQAVRELADNEIADYFTRLEPPPPPEPPEEEKTDLSRQPAEPTTAPALPALGMTGGDTEAPSAGPALDAESAGPILAALEALTGEFRKVSERQAESDKRLHALGDKIDRFTTDKSTGGGDSLALRALGNLETLMDGLSARQREIKGVTLSELDALRAELGKLVSQEEEARRSLSALSARVVSLGNELRDTRLREILERVDANVKDLGSANRRLEASVGSRDETLRVMLENMKSSQGESLRTVGEILNQVEALTARSETEAPEDDGVSSLEKLVEENLTRLTDKLENLAQTQQAIRTRIAEMTEPPAEESAGSEPSPESAQLEALARQVETIATRLGDFASDLTDIRMRLEQPPEEPAPETPAPEPAEVAPEPEPPAAVMEALDNLRTALEDLKQQASAEPPQPPDLTPLQEGLEALGARLTELHERQDQIQEQLNNQLGESLAALTERLESHRPAPEGPELPEPDLTPILDEIHRLREALDALTGRLEQSESPVPDTPPEEPEPSDPALELPPELPPELGEEPEPDETTPPPPFAADELEALRAENQRLLERCEMLERCLEDESRREMEEILYEEGTPEPPPAPAATEDPLPESAEEPPADTLPEEEPPAEEPANEEPVIEEPVAEEPPSYPSHSSHPSQDLPWQPPPSDAARPSETTPEEDTYPIYNQDLVVLIGGKREYDSEYRATAERLGARLERYENIDALDLHQITDLVLRADVLILSQGPQDDRHALMTVGGARAREIALENNRRCFIHHSAQPRSLRRFLVNLVETGQV